MPEGLEVVETKMISLKEKKEKHNDSKIVRAKGWITGLLQDLASPPSSLCADHAPGSSADQMSAHPMEADTTYIRPARASKPQAASQKYGHSSDNKDLAFLTISARISKKRKRKRKKKKNNYKKKWCKKMSNAQVNIQVQVKVS